MIFPASHYGALNRRDVQTLARTTETALDQLSAGVATGWGQQHNPDGSHGDIVATTCACGQFKVRGFVTLDYRSGATSIPTLNVPAGVSVVLIKTLSVGGPLDIYGLKQVGQQFGDMLYLARDLTSAGSSIQLHDKALLTGPTPEGTEFHFASQLAPVGYPIFLLQGEPLPLIYLPGTGTNAVPAWTVPQFVTT